jgi:hypothetical protein
MTIIFRLLTCLLCVTQTTNPDIKLHIEPPSIKAGRTATLSWNVPGVQSIYILGVGEVSNKGSVSVSPGQDTTYTLLLERDSGISSDSVDLKVEDAVRGEDTCVPDPGAFRYPKLFTLTGTPAITFLATLHNLLQNEMGFTVSESQTPPLQPHFVFKTGCSIRSDLVSVDEKQIGARRLAYRIDISATVGDPIGTSSNAASYKTTVAANSQSPLLTYTISSYIQYRRKIESTWRLDQNEDLYNKATSTLHSRLTAPH